MEVSSDGETAIERLVGEKEKFDAVVLDVMLPGVDGFAVAAELRKARNYVPVLMLTARGALRTCCKDSRRAQMIIFRSLLSFQYSSHDCKVCCAAARG